MLSTITDSNQGVRKGVRNFDSKTNNSRRLQFTVSPIGVGGVELDQMILKHQLKLINSNPSFQFISISWHI